MNNFENKKEQEQFEICREELLGIVDESIVVAEELKNDEDLHSCGEKTLDRLEYHAEILRQNVLPASLLAHFQAGKSTTAAAMTDGREIAPCGRAGGGLRTSAISVTIYHDDHSTQAKVNTYTKEQLVHSIVELAGCYLENPDPGTYDLDDPEDRIVLTNAVKREIEVYRMSSDYDLEKLALLRSCILILAFYGCPEYHKLCAGEYTGIDEIRPFIAFTSTEEKKWAGLKEQGFDIVYSQDDSGEPLFSALQCLHVFVEDISIPVHSEFMEETGTAVIDAPGTMASLEDTKRALKAANEAAVVLFILSGERQLAQGDKEMLRVLKNSGMAEKVVFAINFRRNPAIIRQEGGIEESILASLKQEGYCEPHHEHFLYYNAYLAVRAGQGRLILNGTMDPVTEESILEDARKRQLVITGLDEAWCKTTMKVLRAIDADDAADAIVQKGLCAETVELVEKASYWREMILRLRRHVTNNRAAGILRDLGAQPVLNAVAEVENALEAREKALTQQVGDAEKNYQEALKLHTAFSQKVDGILDRNFPASIDRVLAGDYYDNVVLASVDLAAAEAAPLIFKETSLLGNLQDLGDKVKRYGQKSINAISNAFGCGDQVVESAPNGIKEKCHNIISNCFDKASTQYGHRWSNELENGSVYTDSIKTNVLKTNQELTDLWDNMGLSQNDMLSGIPPVPENLSGKMSQDIANSAVRSIFIQTGFAAGSQVSQMLMSFLGGVGTYFGLAFIYMYILPLDFVIPFIAEIVAVLSGVVAAIVYTVSEKQKAKKILQVQDQIAKDMRSGLTKDKAAIVRMIVDGNPNAQPPAPGLSFIRNFYVELYKAAVKNQRQELEENYQQALKDLALSQAARDALAEKAKFWRTEKIEPLRIRLDAALAKIRSIWG